MVYVFPVMRLFSSLVFLLCAFASAFASDLPARADAPFVHVEYFHHDGVPLAALRLVLPAGSYIYAHEVEAGARPTILALRNGEGQSWPVLYPPGVERHVPGFSSPPRVYDSGAFFFVFLHPQNVWTQPPGEDGTLLLEDSKSVEAFSFHGTLSFVLCSGQYCSPQTLELSLRLEKKRLADVAQSPLAEAFKIARPGRPEQADAGALAGQWMTSNRVGDKGQVAALPILEFSRRGSGASGTTEKTARIPSLEEEESRRFTPRVFQGAFEVSGLVPALALGFCAGFLLNFMPCVLPVLFLKVGAFLRPGEGENVRRLREHLFFFSAGILAWFSALSLPLGWTGLIWGQLFQQPVFVYWLTILVFALGLSALGVFTLPLIDLKAGGTASPRIQAFFTGFLATLLATPCSGPLLGGALAWAFTQTGGAALFVVCGAVGFGMALPYLIFAALPGAVRLLPRPGPWLEVLERLLGFFLMGLTVYLLSLLPEERRMTVLAALALLAPAAWIQGRWCGTAASGLPGGRRALLKMTAVILAGIGLFLGAYKAEAPAHNWEEFSRRDFYAALGVKPLMLVFTADWCPNCKVLEHTVLRDVHLRAWQERYDLGFVRVDLTRENAQRLALLRALGSSSIPFTAIFPSGADSARPLVLRDMYSKAQLEEALEQSLSNAARTPAR